MGQMHCILAVWLCQLCPSLLLTYRLTASAIVIACMDLNHRFMASVHLIYLLWTKLDLARDS